jgi:hypothetical protein
MNEPMTETLPETGDDLFAGQPVRVVERDGVRYTLLGTAHVSRASVEAVEKAIDSGRFDAVAVELDPQRLQALSDPDTLAKLDLVEVIRKGRVALFAANLALSAYQRRLAEQLDIEPGAELKRAVELARERDLPVHLIDREVGLTFRRASQRLGFFGKLKLVAGLGAGLFSSEEVGENEIEKLKQGDMLESSFGEFASESPALYETIIGERDRYMATRLREEHNRSSVKCWRWSVPVTWPGWRATWKPTPRHRRRCAPSWRRCRRSATFRGSRWASWRSWRPASAWASTAAVWAWAPSCWRPGRCIPAAWRAWAACWQAVTR